MVKQYDGQETQYHQGFSGNEEVRMAQFMHYIVKKGGETMTKRQMKTMLEHMSDGDLPTAWDKLQKEREWEIPMLMEIQKRQIEIKTRKEK